MRQYSKKEKVELYKKLVEEINNFNGLQAINKKAKLELKPYSKCNEVNLWAYWEGGIEHLDAKILVVGQDWGSLSYKGETIVKSIVSATYDRDSFQYMNGNRNPTNKTIQKLFEGIGIDVEHDNNERTDLFFTNFIPWYRADGNKISGGSVTKWIEPSASLFSRLVDIIKPKIILCLGKTVFDGVLLAAGKKYDYTEKKYYNDVIVEGAFTENFGEEYIYVVPLAHSGNFGNLNRNEKKMTTFETRYEKQIQDWKAWYELLTSNNIM